MPRNLLTDAMCALRRYPALGLGAAREERDRLTAARRHLPEHKRGVRRVGLTVVAGRQ